MLPCDIIPMVLLMPQQQNRPKYRPLLNHQVVERSAKITDTLRYWHDNSKYTLKQPPTASTLFAWPENVLGLLNNYFNQKVQERTD